MTKTESHRSPTYITWCKEHNYRLKDTDKVIPLDENSKDTRKLYQIGSTTKLKTHKQLVKAGSEFFDALENFYTALRETEKALNTPDSPYQISIQIPEHLVQTLRVLGKKIHEAPRTTDNRYKTYTKTYRGKTKAGKSYSRVHVIRTDEILPDKKPINILCPPAVLKTLGTFATEDWTQVN